MSEHFVVRLDRGYSEKRDFIRMKAVTQIVYSILEQPEKFTGTTKNFNAQGVLFASEKYIEPETKLHISINSLNGRVNHLTGTAVVKRADKVATGYDIACQIIELS